MSFSIVLCIISLRNQTGQKFFRGFNVPSKRFKWCKELRNRPTNKAVRAKTRCTLVLRQRVFQTLLTKPLPKVHVRINLLFHTVPKPGEQIKFNPGLRRSMRQFSSCCHLPSWSKVIREPNARLVPQIAFVAKNHWAEASLVSDPQVEVEMVTGALKL